MSPTFDEAPRFVLPIVERSSSKRMKEYWFVIYPHCFLWVKSEKGLIYNTENHAKISFSNTGILSHVVGKLSAMENLYCIRLTEKELENQDVAEWIQ